MTLVSSASCGGKDDLTPEQVPEQSEEKPVEAAPIVVETEGDGVKEVAVEPLAETIIASRTVPGI